MLTKKQAQRLNGLIATMERTARQAEHAGAQQPEDADQIRADRIKAKKALNEYIRSLTQKD